MSTALADTHVIARKAYRCDLCGYTITKGTRHRVYSVASDGSVSRFREHILCTRYAGDDEEWYALDPDGPYLGLLHALADIDDTIAAMPGFYPLSLDWRPWDAKADPHGREAQWWRYRVVRRRGAAWVMRIIGGREVAHVGPGRVVRATCEPARRLAAVVALELAAEARAA